MSMNSILDELRVRTLAVKPVIQDEIVETED